MNSYSTQVSGPALPCPSSDESPRPFPFAQGEPRAKAVRWFHALQHLLTLFLLGQAHTPQFVWLKEYPLLDLTSSSQTTTDIAGNIADSLCKGLEGRAENSKPRQSPLRGTQGRQILTLFPPQWASTSTLLAPELCTALLSRCPQGLETCILIRPETHPHTMVEGQVPFASCCSTSSKCSPRIQSCPR